MTQTIDLDDAGRLVLEHARVCADHEELSLLASLGRRLGRDFRCDEPWPTTDRSAMDGFALCGGDGVAAAGTRFEVVGAALAGHPFDGELGPGQAVRIMTGGVVPAGADRVAKVEDTSGFGRSVDGGVELTAEVAPAANIRPLGSEIAAGTTVLRAGARIGAAEVGALAVLGVIDVEVVRRPRVAILSTGDEVVDIAAAPASHQVRDSNSWSLAAKVVEAGGEVFRLGIVADDPASLRAALERGLDADVLLTIGGVSKGTHDLVHGTLAELGVDQVFHGVALKPGKPTFFGERQRGGRHSWVFGLPGNPASAFTTFDLLVLPLLCRFGGGQAPAPLRVAAGGARWRRNWRAQAIPARLATDADGRAVAELSELRPSGDPFSLLAGDGYGIVPGDRDPASPAAIGFLGYAGAPRAGGA